MLVFCLALAYRLWQGAIVLLTLTPQGADMTFATGPVNLAQDTLAQDNQAALLERLADARRAHQLSEGVDVDGLPFWGEFWSAIEGRQAPPRIVQGSTDLECHAAFLGLSVAQLQGYLHLVVTRDHEALDVEHVQFCHHTTRQLWRAKMCADIARNLASR